MPLSVQPASAQNVKVAVRLRNIPSWQGGRLRTQTGGTSAATSTAAAAADPYTTIVARTANRDPVSGNFSAIAIADPDGRKPNKDFYYDCVFSPDDGQQTVYDRVVRPIIERCLEGYKAAGKTYTMQGPSGSTLAAAGGGGVGATAATPASTRSGRDTSRQAAPSAPQSQAQAVSAIPDTEKGIIFRVADQIIHHIQMNQPPRSEPPTPSLSSAKPKAGAGLPPLPAQGRPSQGPYTEFTVMATYLEIYQEQLKDLLGPPEEQGGLRIRIDPNSVSGHDLHVEGLTERQVVTESDYLRIIQMGAKHRTVAETNMNEVSSRSHSVLTLTIDQIQRRGGGLAPGADDMGAKKRSKIHLIDLAGSERADSTGATGARLKEGSAINQSLSCLGNVINALTTSAHHIPYRDSKLTYLLSDSLGGNSLTAIIACVTPIAAAYEESLSTLRFAERAKKVTNRARTQGLLARCTCGAGARSGATGDDDGDDDDDGDEDGDDANGVSRKASARSTGRKRPSKVKLFFQRLFCCWCCCGPRLGTASTVYAISPKDTRSPLDDRGRGEAAAAKPSGLTHKSSFVGDESADEDNNGNEADEDDDDEGEGEDEEDENEERHDQIAKPPAKGWQPPPSVPSGRVAPIPPTTPTPQTLQQRSASNQAYQSAPLRPVSYGSSTPPTMAKGRSASTTPPTRTAPQTASNKRPSPSSRR
ncbi:P-loop containing nucleoside triphosphate hydrolase protein [Entophlyctis helioformis]|nr:P-loop containing nucleoside triphosphate hydrolase protein [Entophlyctis helioformis]